MAGRSGITVAREVWTLMAGKKAAKAGPGEGSGRFRGFGSQALPFLAALKENNDREWFAANKGIFLEELDGPFRELIGEVGGLLAASGSILAPVARNPIYRIYRDVRFSKDKSPYKTNLGAGLHRGGEKSSPGLVYVHVEPGGSFLAAGFYQPEAPRLKLLRDAIAGGAGPFAKLIEALAAKGLALHRGDPIGRMPKGYEALADSPVAASIRMRSFLVSRPLADDDLERRDLPSVIAGFAEDASPFLRFFWAGLDRG